MKILKALFWIPAILIIALLSMTCRYLKTVTILFLVSCVTICNAQITDPERTERVLIAKLDRHNPTIVSGDFGTFLNNYTTIDSIVAQHDGSIAYYYSNDLWKERYYALKKLRSYGYFRIPYHNRKKFIKAEKIYKQLMKDN